MSIKEQIVEELHKPARKTFRRRHVVVKGINDLFQADLVEMLPYAKHNKGYRYILVVINAFTKFLWAIPVKRKTGHDVAIAFKKILHQNVPRNLQTDNGKEFYNKDFKRLVAQYNINHYSTYSALKSSIVERVNRTLKNMMWKEFSKQGSYKWLSLLPNLVLRYNSTKHRTTGYKPIEITKRLVRTIRQRAFNNNRKTLDVRKPKFMVGTYVRVSKHRTVFDKGYTPNWTTEVFKIRQVKHTNPTTYLLVDANNQNVQGGFYEQELQNVQHPDAYLVEKILQRRGNKVLVKWLGLDRSHNAWLPKSDLLL